MIQNRPAPSDANGLTVRVHGYKAFRDETALRIRPLTLLYGHNQAGKSTLVRLLAWLADSIRSDSGPLDMRSSALCGASFKELGWLGPNPNFSPSIELQGPYESESAFCRFTWTWSASNSPELNEFQVWKGASRDNRERLFYARIDSVEAGATKYSGFMGQEEWTGVLQTNSLFPQGLPDGAAAACSAVHLATTQLQEVLWLGANRLAGSGAGTQRHVREYRSDGSDLPYLLQNQPAVVRHISQWFEQQFRSKLELSTNIEGRPGFYLRSPGWEHLPIHLAGEGVRSLLPIIAHAAWAESRKTGAPKMLAIEEPESHLHPNLQIAMLNRLIETTTAGVPVVLETHSVHVLRAVQLAVLNGDIAASSVGLYWCSSEAGVASLGEATIDANGRLLGWPPAVFEEEQALGREIVEKRWGMSASTVGLAEVADMASSEGALLTDGGILTADDPIAIGDEGR